MFRNSAAALVRCRSKARVPITLLAPEFDLRAPRRIRQLAVRRPDFFLGEILQAPLSEFREPVALSTMLRFGEVAIVVVELFGEPVDLLACRVELRHQLTPPIIRQSPVR